MRFDEFIKFMGVELFEWQEILLREFINNRRPITLLMPKQVGYLQAMTEREKNMRESDYYWEKAEFQDPWSHRQHVENYKKGFHSSIFFDEQYAKEAEEELKGE